MREESTETGTSPRPTYAMRLGRIERAIIEAAARQRGEALSAYIRRTALATARRELGVESGEPS